LLFVIDSNEFIFGLGSREHSAMALIDILAGGSSLHSIRIPRTIFEEVKRNVSTEAFGEFLMLIETGALTLDEDIVVPFELGLRYEKMGFKPADSFIAAYAEWVMADALVSENRHFLFDHPHLPFKTLSAESALKYIKSSSLK